MLNPFNKFTKFNTSKGINYIIQYNFNPVILNRFVDVISKTQIELSLNDVEEVKHELRVYFLAVLLKQRDRVDGLILMYNSIVDELWHTLILDTTEYDKFCKNAFGEFLHHQLTDNMPIGLIVKSSKITEYYTDLAEKLIEDRA